MTNNSNNIYIQHLQLSEKREKEIHTYRLLLFISMFLYPLFGYVNVFVLNPAIETTSHFYQRLVMSALILISLMLTHRNVKYRKHMHIIIVGFIYLGISHLLFIVYNIGLIFNHTAGILMFIMGTSLVFKRNIDLLIYLAISMLGIIVISFTSPTPELSRETVIMVFFSTSLVIFVAMKGKIDAEQNLKKNEANLNALIENTNDLIWSVDQNMILLTSNKAYREMRKTHFGVEPKVGEKIDLSNYPQNIQKNWKNYYERALSGESFSTENEYFYKGKIEIVEHSFNPIISNRNKIKGVSIFARIITEVKKAEITLRKNEESLKAAHQLAKMGSYERNFISNEYTWSDYMYEIFQLPKDTDIKNYDFRKLIHPDDYASMMNEFEKNLQTGKTFSLMYRIVRADQSTIDVLANINPIKDTDGKLIKIKGTLQDISERNKLIKERDEAEYKGKLKETFLANMSHEIRTPMNAIVGLSNLLIKNPSQAKKEEYIQTININARNLLGIINDILDFSKIESGKMQIENTQFNLKECLEQIHKSFQLPMEDKGISFIKNISNDIPNYVTGDSIKLNQILTNLLSNALKFTPKGSITLNAKTKNIDAQKINIEFSVSDTGIGIDNEKQKVIFDSFTQANSSTTREYGGTGLGLAIVKKLVELQSGTIELKSEVGKGACFTFNVVYNIGEKDKVHSSIKPQTSMTKNLKILLVEDNSFNQMVAEDTLKDINPHNKVEIAENGKIAIKMLQDNLYDLILMDIQMPELDGHETAKFIRNEMKLKIPIIAMTAHASSEEVERCLKNGMNDYISKPFEESVLIEKINKSIN